MKRRISLVALVAVVGLWTGMDLLACGDKFLVAGRGTRYQRPKNFRAASVLIYANPSTGLEAALQKLPVESVLKREGHRFTTVATPEQLSGILASGRFDVVLAASGDATAVEQLLGGRPDAPIVLAFCVKGQEQPVAEGAACALKAPPKERRLLDAIDKAVERHDQNSRRAQIRL
ncbi:MAG TPA: hypothetical protein VGS98_09030 [Thermoanaerobaculia bacterium]|jgi:hypothetical protein|nr:hypothetical protein [Thermoanaerobaculia bacterium]